MNHSRQPINQQFQRIETGVDNTLVLRNVQRHHEGNYTCQVRNALGTDSIVYQLLVHVPPGDSYFYRFLHFQHFFLFMQ